MDHGIIIAGVVVLALVFLFFRGDKTAKQKNALNKQIEDIYGPMTEVVEDVSYQGGFPQMPKPARLNLGMTESELVLFDKAGNNGSIEYDKIKKVDSFTTRKERKRKFGIVAYGPLALVLNKPNMRYFFIAEYKDINEEDNIMMVTVRSKDIADGLYSSLRPYVKKNKRR
jgi:hypothetical protein